MCTVSERYSASDSGGIAAFDPLILRRAFAAFPSGVAAVAALADDRPAGMCVSSFVSVSLDPPLVSICIAKTSSTWPLLESQQRLGVNVLSSAQGDLARALSRKDGNRFFGIAWEATERGAIFIEESVLRLECSLAEQVDAGDHIIALLAVEQLCLDPEVEPIVFHRSTFRSLA